MRAQAASSAVRGVIRRPQRPNPWVRRRRQASADASTSSGADSYTGASTGRPAALSPSYARELAGRARTEYTWLDGEEPHPSRILADHSDPSHRVGELYKVMRRDDSVLAGLLDKRTKAVLGLPRWILPGDSSPLALEIAQFCRAALARVPKLHTNLEHQLTGILDGVAIDELVWQRADVAGRVGAWVPRDILDRPMWRFAFVNGRLHIRLADGKLEPAPVGRFLVNTCGSKDTRWGEALLDSCYWHWWLKLKGWKYYAVAIEKWSQPNIVGKYPRAPGSGDTAATANAERQGEVLAIVDDVLADTGVAIPEDVVLELLEAKGNAAQSYEQFIALCDRANAVRILGEVDTSGLGKGPGSYAKARVANEVRYETIVADAHELATHLTDNLLRPLVAFNFGPQAPMPRWWIDTEEATDRESRRKGLQLFLEIDGGVDEQGTPRLRAPVSHVYQVCQVPQPRDGEPTIARPATGAPPSPSSTTDTTDDAGAADAEEAA